MILTTARVIEAALAFTAIFVSVRAPRHRPFAAWISLSLIYSLADHLWIVPMLGQLPRPFTGAARVYLHASQLLYIAVHVAFVHVVFDLARVRRSLRPLPYFVGFIALVVLVDGYAHSREAGLYTVAGYSFRSRTVYTGMEIAVNALVLGTLLPQLRVLIDESRSTDDSAVLGSVLAIELGALAQNVFDMAPGRFAASAVPFGYLLAYAAALGFQVPVAVLHVLGHRSPEFRRRAAVASRRDAIFEMSRRLELSRAAFAAGCRDGRPDLDSFPTAGPIARRAGRSMELLSLAVEDLEAAGTVEFILSVVWGLGPDDAANMLAQIEDASRDAAARTPHESRDEFDWMTVFKLSSVGPETFLAPISMSAFSVLRGLTWDQALNAIRFARAVGEGAALAHRQQSRFRARSY